MPKGQQKSNKEAKKPKQVKEAPKATAGFTKGISGNESAPKKK